MARYDANGDLEKTSEERQTASTEMTSLVRQSDGKLLLAGYAPNGSGNVALAVARYDEELNLREIGEILGVSESRVCQIHGQALIRLRARMGEWLSD